MGKDASIRPAAWGFGTFAGGKQWAGQPAGTSPLQGEVFPAPEPAAEGGEAGVRERAARGASRSDPVPPALTASVAAVVFTGEGAVASTHPPRRDSPIGVLLAGLPASEPPAHARDPQAAEAAHGAHRDRLSRALAEATGLVPVGGGPSDRVGAVADRVARLALEPVEQLTLGVALLESSAGRGRTLDTGRDGTIAVARDALIAAISRTSADAGAAETSHGETPEEVRAGVLLEALARCAGTPAFRRIVTALVRDLDRDGSEGGHQDVGHLRRYLQAGVQADAHSGAIAADQAFAQRVRDATVRTLTGVIPPSEAARRIEQRDAFYWDCGFRSEAPGSALHRARTTFESFTDGLDGRSGSLLRPMREHGLLGATHHNRTDVIAHVELALRGPEEICSPKPRSERYTGKLLALAAALLPKVMEEVDRDLVGLAAQVRAPRDDDPWLRQRTDESRASALRHRRDDLVLAMRVEAVLERMARATDDTPLTGAQALGGLDPEEAATRIEARLLARDIGWPGGGRTLRATIEDQGRVGVHAVLNAAGRLSDGDGAIGRALQACDTIGRELRADNRRPSDPQAAGAPPHTLDVEIVDFVRDAYFGNHAGASKGESWTVHGRALPNIGRIVSGGPDSSATSFDWYPTSFGATGEFERGSARQMRIGAATHGFELFLGNQTSNRVAGRVTVPLLQVSNDWGGHAFYGEAGFEARSVDNTGLIFRVDRVGTVTRDEPDGQGRHKEGFVNNDEDVRRMGARLARTIFDVSAAPREAGREAPGRLDAVVEDLAGLPRDEFDLDLLSLQASDRQSASRAFPVSFGSVARMTFSAGNDTRLGAGVQAGVELKLGVRSSGSQAEHVDARLSVNGVRDSVWGTQLGGKGALTAIAQFGGRQVTVPLMGLVSGSLEGSSSETLVKIRAPRRHGEIVPEKTFLDLETGSLPWFRKLVEAELGDWLDSGRADGSALQVRKFFDDAQATRHEDHVYYLRKRLHPDVARRVDALTSLQRQLPERAPAKGGLGAEIRRLVDDRRAWVPASLITYHKEGRTRDRVPELPRPPLTTTNGLRWKAFEHAESEREIDFNTVGWPGLHRLEQSPAVKARIAALLRGEPEVGSGAEGPLEEVVVEPATPFFTPPGSSRPGSSSSRFFTPPSTPGSGSPPESRPSSPSGLEGAEPAAQAPAGATPRGRA